VLAAAAAVLASGACVSAGRAAGTLVDVATSALSEPAPVWILEPPSYAFTPERSYPVLYFLHDFYGNRGSLAAHGVAAELARRMADGRLPEFFVVAPSGPGTWFSDSFDGRNRYERFLTQDLIRFVESRYRVARGSEGRGITGISMGGYGAIKIALKYPQLYGSVSSLSGAMIPFGPDDLPRYSWVTRWSLKRVFGSGLDANSLAANDAWRILLDSCFERPPFQAHLRAGTSDIYGLDGVAAQFGSLLNERGVPTTVVLEPGGHDWNYWSRALLAIAQWHGRRFSYDDGAASRHMAGIDADR
jgi:S-formylglutathione hydrolase FrmB